MLTSQPAGVGVVPNVSQVCGTLVRVAPERDGNGSLWKIAVDETRDVDGMPNFAQAYVGDTIQVYVHPHLRADVTEKGRVQARVAFRGDERGGHFVLVEDDVHRL